MSPRLGHVPALWLNRLERRLQTAGYELADLVIGDGVVLVPPRAWHLLAPKDDEDCDDGFAQHGLWWQPMGRLYAFPTSPRA